MNTRILTTLTALIISLPSFSQVGDHSTKSDQSDGPRITFTEMEHDFGAIKPGADAVHYFVFSNTGVVPLIILNVRTSCGCMVPAWPKAPVSNGMKDSIMVEYNTKIKGTFNKIITVQSNAVNAMVELKIKGNVIKAK